MNIARPTVQKSKIGTCPHGLPQGACPICNGSGGGGGSTKKAQNAGEMSWDECYAVWQQMLKAKELQQQKKEQALQAQISHGANQALKMGNAADKIANLAQKLADFVQKVQTQSLPIPKFIAKPLALLAQIALPVLNVVKNAVVVVQKAINFIQSKLADISDKLNAMFGEMKNSTEKKISDALKNFKKKLKSLFGVLEAEETSKEQNDPVIKR